ncbi:hypothetical protein [uncultured Lacinutrix sp.]|uniref:hypothetical protein n=1 Tax=uncultured Lacinutrix sp. TaxID=574032 RepID=UPI002611815F|nr:hypothetical protein [uncultured Lacinutrix sp.]
MKKTLFIISLSVLLIAQQKNKDIQEASIAKKNYEPQLEQKLGEKVNSLHEDILNNKEQTLENKNNISNLFITKLGTQGLLISLFFSVLGFFGLGYYLKQYLKKKINKNVISLERECDISIKKVEKIKDDTILRIQNTEKLNKDLRTKSQILLISETSTPVNDTIEHIFEKESAKVAFNCVHIRIKELSFKQVKTVLANKGNLLPSDFNMMVLDNCDAENRYWEGEHYTRNILNFTAEFLTRKVGVLYFSNDQRFPSRDIAFRNVPNRYLLDYVNSHAHLYANTMNVLKLQNLYKE